MNENSIFLFSVRFPYGIRGGFIKNELPFLQNSFKEVVIFPISDHQILQEIQGNVKLKYLFKNVQNQSLSIKGWIELFSILFFEFRKIPLKKKLFFIKSIRPFIAELKIGIVRANILQKWMKENNILIEKTIFYSFWFMEWSLVLSILKRRKVITSYYSRAHGSDLFNERWKGEYFPFRYFKLTQISKLILVSQAGLNYMNEKFTSFKDKFEFSPLGTKTPISVPQKQNEHIFTIVTCSNLVPLKRVQLMIDILSVINFPVHWVHFGDGSDQERTDFLRSTQKLPQNIKFSFKGRVTNEEIYKFYSEQFVDVFVLLSESEGGIPVSLQEASSFGIPLIATDAGGVNEIVNPNTGILLPLYPDIKFISDSITKIYLKEISFDRNKIIAFWNENFAAEKRTNNLIEILSSVR